jgi:hypothetical protein
VTLQQLPEQVREVVADLLPHFEGMVDGRHAVALGGSFGKNAADSRSDLDFRLFYDRLSPDEARLGVRRAQIMARIEAWTRRGVRVDGYWPRRIADIEAALEGQLAGDLPQAMVWSVWGYHLLTDLSSLLVVSDPWGVIRAWGERLAVFPPPLKAALIERHAKTLSYWRRDYHYESKAERGDPVFCHGVATTLIHAVFQILFALNEVYYVGDGRNLECARAFRILPRDFERRVRAALFTADGGGALRRQREALVALADDVLALL